VIVPLVVVTLTFAVMEVVSYLVHRFVMHGPGMVWHASHHAAPTPGPERNDLFPLCFSLLGVLVFAASAVIHSGGVFWVGVGIAAYGGVYLFVHEIAIHRRVRVPIPDFSYLRWVREAHRAHHLTGGEYFGMLFPVRFGASSSRASVRVLSRGDDRLDRGARSAASTRSARIRL
jgi:beta-carotene 3-hydroxylase